MLDLLGILSASQALSSETSIDRLHARVVQVLSAMTGATGVHLLLGSDDRQDWLLPAPGGAIPVSGAGHEPAVPMSALRYARRTREPLVVDDATRDDRFAQDPYFSDLTCCSMLALPILSRGTLRRERLCFSFRWWAEPGRGGIAAPAALVQVPVAGHVMLVTLLGPGGEGVGRSRVCDGCCHRASFEVVVDVNVVAGALDW
jgi:hypothetical protein